ncbi:tautomerase family protein [uncultured Roseibium sp.]|uniref:nuclear transport factor 2 family protein n=1 Tax=uncultured Roseibium sp. TaxID=1936171 RepID=UPI00262FA2C3|nr:tautomerase family protein [uncultured Roseibium sp.]
MPSVHVHLMAGYTPADKTRLMKALSDAVRFVVPAAPEAVSVFLNEVPASDYMRGGTHRTPAPALQDPAAVVLEYLKAMEARDLDKAQAHLGADFRMVFPGTGKMATIAELIDWARPRYRFVTKTYQGVEAFQGESSAIVYTRGTLSGEWPDGSHFSGIRFIDRFEVTNNKITRQDVWNDIAEIKGKA